MTDRPDSTDLMILVVQWFWRIVGYGSFAMIVAMEQGWWMPAICMGVVK